MNKTQKLFDEMKKCRLIALLTPKSAEECLAAYEIFQPEEIIVEIAFRSEHALNGIRLIKEKHPDALLLAGTVMTQEQAESAIETGAAGIVSADYIPGVIDICVENDIMCVPGGLADAGKQLVRKAERYGCSLEELKENYPYQWIYKLFPAYSGGTCNLGLALSWRGPYRDLTVIYTGGISLKNLPEAVHTDREGIFCASALTGDIHDPERVKEEIQRWKALLKPTETKEEIVESPARGEPRSITIPESGVPSVVTFGELMIRLSPTAGVRLRNAGSLDLNFGGAAANVSVSVARFGLHSSFVSVLPENDLGENATTTLRSHEVNVEHILRSGRRMGTYYLEHGSGLRPSKVIYDRAHSAFSQLAPVDFDWERILDGANWFHWTGITPALGDSAASALRNALDVAREKGIYVSADLNYRSKLWSVEEAREVMSDLMPDVDLLIANEEDPAILFGIEPVDTDIEAGRLNVEGYRTVAAELIERFGFRKVAITLRESISASENMWTACLHTGEEFYLSPTYHLQIIDRVGTGDAFAAGLIYGIVTGRSDKDSLNFGVAASCLKHSIYGDFNLVDVYEVDRLAEGQISGRVQR